MAPIYVWGTTVSRLQNQYGEDSLLVTAKFPEIPGTHLLASEGWKTDSTLELLSDFDLGTHGLGILGNVLYKSQVKEWWNQ